MGYVIGELVYVAAGIAYLAEEGGGGLPGGEGLRRKLLLVVHLLLVLSGLELAVAAADIGPPWLLVATRAGNLFALAVVPVVVVKGYPTQLRAMLDETLTPVLFGAIWAAASQAADGGRVDWAQAVAQPVIFVGLHHLAVIAPLFLGLLVDPPARAMASSLPLRQRLTSGPGLFWLGLMGLWLAQCVVTLVALAELAFGSGLVPGSVGATLFLTSVGRSVRRLKGQVVRGV